MSAAWGRIGLVEIHSTGCPRAGLESGNWLIPVGCNKQMPQAKRTVVSRRFSALGRLSARRDPFPSSQIPAAKPSVYIGARQVRWQSNQHGRWDQLKFPHAAASSSLPPEEGTKTIAASLQSSITKFSKLWKGFLPMCILFFGMAFVNTIVNSLALTLVVTSHGGGAQVLPYLTVYAALPSSLLFMVLYTYALQRMERRHVFTLIVGLFAIFNLVFGLVLYPNHQNLHLHSLADQLSKVLPQGLSGAVGMARNWTFTLFYCMSELWGDVGLSLLFWGLANETTKLEDAAVLYPLFGFGANIAQVLAGMVLRASSSGETGFVHSFQNLIFLLFGCKIAIIVLHEWIISKQSSLNHGHRETYGSRSQFTKNVDGEIKNERGHHMNSHASHDGRVTKRSTTIDDFSHEKLKKASNTRAMNGLGADSPLTDVDHGTQKEKKKKALSMIEAMRMLSQTPQIQSLGIITVSQCLAVNLMEFVWKSQLRIAYPSPAAFTSFMGDVSTATGMVTCCLMLVSPVLFDRLNWGQVAGLTPKILCFGGIAFFASGIGHQVFSKLGMLGVSQCLLPVAILGGAILYVVARGVKFSLFKPAEEMVYITLDEDSRTKGKAAIDVVGAQVGKAGGSLLQQVLLLISGGALIGITPAIFGVYLIMLHSWQKGIDNLAATQMKTRQETPHNKSNVANLDKLSNIQVPGEGGSDNRRKHRQYVEFQHYPVDIS